MDVLTINGLAVRATSMKIKAEHIIADSSGTSETGYDVVEYVRMGKRTLTAEISGSFSHIRTTLEQLQSPPVEVGFLDPLAGEMVTVQMHLDGHESTLVAAYDISGIWSVPITLIEY